MTATDVMVKSCMTAGLQQRRQAKRQLDVKIPAKVWSKNAQSLGRRNAKAKAAELHARRKGRKPKVHSADMQALARKALTASSQQSSEFRYNRKGKTAESMKFFKVSKRRIWHERLDLKAHMEQNTFYRICTTFCSDFTNFTR